MKSHTVAALAAVALFSPAAQAGIAEELIAAINKCAALADDGMRHSCFDRLAEKVKSLTPAVAGQTAVAPAPSAGQPAPTAPTAAATLPSPPAAESNGFFASLFGDSDNDHGAGDQFTATVESWTSDFGVFVVTLDNGQVWRQVAAVGDLVHLSKDAKDKVTIWRNSVGDYILKIDGYRTKYHVRRIK